MKASGALRAGVCLALAGGAVAAQEGAEAERPAAAPLKVHLVVSRHSGEKKVSTLAYSFPCNARDRKTVLKSGVEVPVPGRKGEAVEFQYRNVGTNIECEAALVAGGRYGLRISFEHSALVGDDKTAGSPPSFRISMSQFTAVVQAGQTVQVVSGTDPLTGEVTAVDVTLTAPK